MSNKTDPKDNVRFLISCIHHSANGRPNFDLVAKELDIVSKGAAGKRYERLIKSCNASPGGKPSGAAPAADDEGDEEPAKPAAKKRKAPAAAASTPKTPAVKKAKAAPRGKKVNVKTEEEDDVKDEDIKAVAESESSLSDAPEDLDENVKAEEA